MRIGSLTLLVVLAARPAHALTVTPEAVAAKLKAAQLVAEIDVRAVEGLPDPDHGIGHRATARVTALVSARDGDARWLPDVGDDIIIRGAGGELGDKGLFLSGYPRPARGKRYRAYLNRRSNGTYEVTGFENGLVPLGAERQSSRNRTDGSNGEGDGPYLFWDDSYFPIPYFISAATFQAYPDFIPAIDRSLGAWRNVPNTRFELVAMGCSSATRNENDGTNNVILITKGWAFDPAAIAITRNFYVSGTSAKSGMILDSDILLNGVNHGFTVTGEPGKHDVENIVTHEAGHFLGLGHEVSPADPEATMYAVASPGELKKRVLHASDIAGITGAYPGAGNKYATPPQTANCVLGVPTSCVAVHHRETMPRLLGLDIGGAWLALLLVAGRLLTARLRRN